MDKAWRDVGEFHRAFGIPALESPALLSQERVKARSDWMREEIEEFLSSETLAEQADAMIDLMYFALGTLVEMGVRPQELFDIVHEANMCKIWPDGTVHRRESDGKILKPPQWQDPEPLLQKALRNQGF